MTEEIKVGPIDHNALADMSVEGRLVVGKFLDGLCEPHSTVITDHNDSELLGIGMCQILQALGVEGYEWT